MIRYLFLIGIFLGISFFGYSQINESDTVRLQTRLAITGAWQTGNVAMFTTRNKLDLTVTPIEYFVFKTQNTYLYQAFFNKKADEDLSSRNFIYWKPQKTVYPFVMFFASKSFRRNIDFRYFAGFGATWQIIKHQGHTLKVALSGIYEQTNFSKTLFNKNEYDGSEKITTPRATVWLFGKHQIVKDKISFHYECFLQPSVEKNNNLRWQTEAGLDIFLTKKFSFTTNYLYTYESVVTLGQKDFDSILTFGLSYQIRK